MTLYVIFPIHLNFPKLLSFLEFPKAAIIPSKKQWIVLRLLENKSIISGDLCMFHVMPWNIFSPKWRFPAFYGLYQKKFLFFNHGGEHLINTYQISQFRENVSSFNFLANALKYPFLY